MSYETEKVFPRDTCIGIPTLIPRNGLQNQSKLELTEEAEKEAEKEIGKPLETAKDLKAGAKALLRKAKKMTYSPVGGIPDWTTVY